MTVQWQGHQNYLKLQKKFNLKFITIKDLIEYRVKNESLIKEMANVKLPTKFGDFKIKLLNKLQQIKFI